MRVAVVDDDKLVAMSLKTILEMDDGVEIVGIGLDGDEAVSLYRQQKPDVLLMDIRMQGKNGLEAAEEILTENKNAVILFLTTFSDDEYIIRALKLGVKGYILKQDFESILPALRAVSSGQSVFGGEIVSRLPGLINQETRSNPENLHLNEKELAIMKQVASGKNNREIGESLYLSEGTVRNYISEILEKLQLRDRTQLAIFYLKNW